MERYDMNVTVYPSQPGRDETVAHYSTMAQSPEDARRKAIALLQLKGKWVRKFNHFRRRKIHDA